MTTKVRTTTVEKDDGEQLDDDGESSPLFDLGQDKKSKSIDRISVYRVDPDEGHLGYLGRDADEKEIKAKYGGGEFRLQAKNSSGQIVKTLSNYKISGDPIFQSNIAEARWLRLNKIHGRAAGGTEAPASTMREILDTMEERERLRREEERERREEERRDRQEREEKARKEQMQHEEKLAREAADREERRRKDEAEREDRRRKEQREDEDRRARLHREDLERIEKSNAAQLAQTQQFFQQLAALTKKENSSAAAADPVKMLTTGMDIALKLGGRGGGDGEPQDALTALLSRLPETLGELRSTAKEAYNEIKSSKQRKGGGGAARQLSPRSSDDAGGSDVPQVTISGPTAGRLKQAIDILERAGKDPETLFSGVADHVIKMADGGPRTKPRAPAPRAARPAAPRARPARGRAAVKPAATKRAAAARRTPAAKGAPPT
jgi:hypothetical protein